MNRLREKLHIPKAQSYHEPGSSLEAMLRDSLYLAWPMASVKSESKERPRGMLKKTEAIDEGDEDDDE